MPTLQHGVQWPVGRGSNKFFLPAGNIDGLENDLLYLVELWHIPVQDVMAIPYSRRKRMVESKDQLERRRKQEAESASSRAKARRRK